MGTGVVGLKSKPDAVLRTPDEVTEWIAGQIDEHAARITVTLIANAEGPGGIGRVGDGAHIDYASAQHFDDACRGHSLYVDFRREQDRLHLWGEAVTTEHCPEVHDQ